MYTQEEITKAFGPYVPGDISNPEYIEQCIQEIELFPAVLKAFFPNFRPTTRMLVTGRGAGLSDRSYTTSLTAT